MAIGYRWHWVADGKVGIGQYCTGIVSVLTVFNFFNYQISQGYVCPNVKEVPTMQSIQKSQPNINGKTNASQW
jgi:hypothetical protein